MQFRFQHSEGQIIHLLNLRCAEIGKRDNDDDVRVFEWELIDFFFVSAGIFKMSNSKSIFRNNVKIWHAMNVIVFDIQPIDWWTNSFDNEITFYASNRKIE